MWTLLIFNVRIEIVQDILVEIQMIYGDNSQERPKCSINIVWFWVIHYQGKKKDDCRKSISDTPFGQVPIYLNSLQIGRHHKCKPQTEIRWGLNKNLTIAAKISRDWECNTTTASGSLYQCYLLVTIISSLQQWLNAVSLLNLNQSLSKTHIYEILPS